jgi:fluoroquinolone transport system permease protein
MKIVRVFRALGPIDLRNVRRDSMLLWLPILPVFLALLFRFGLPALSVWIAERYAFDLKITYPLIVSVFVPMVGGFAGIVIGFLLLDERDDQTLLALMVTPMPPTSYLIYRLGLPMVISTVTTLAVFPLIGLVSISAPLLIAIAFLSSFAAPIIALFLATIAENKVAGLALMKLLNGILMLPVVAYFIPEPWQFLAGMLPTYWPLKVFWAASQGDPTVWVYLIIGLVINAGFLTVVVRLFNRALHR